MNRVSAFYCTQIFRVSILPPAFNFTKYKPFLPMAIFFVSPGSMNAVNTRCPERENISRNPVLPDDD